MKNNLYAGFIILLIGVVLIVSGCARKDDTAMEQPDISGTVSLANNVMPLFVRSCGACHKREGGNPAAVANGAYFETKEDILGKVGSVIIAGKPEESGLLKVLDQSMPVGKNGIVMPPPGTPVPRWKEKELELLSRWIARGAGDN